MKEYKALAFDFDGTLFDTQILNLRAYRQAYKHLGIDITEQQFAKTRGKSVYDFNKILGVNCNVESLRQLKADYYAKIVTEAVPNIYLIDILKCAHEDGIKTSIVTTARMQNIVPLLYKYDIWNYIDVFVTQEDVKHYKPSSDCYKIACERLDCIPEDILAFEDGEVGIKAAKNAGISVIRVPEVNAMHRYISEFKGGSGVKILLQWDFVKHVPVVCKMSQNEESNIKLCQQAMWLYEHQKQFSVVKLMNMGISEDRFYYTMEYIDGVELYEHPKRKELLHQALSTITMLNRSNQCVEINTRDIRQDLFIKYIKPGVDIFNRITGDNRQYPYLDCSEIPQFVNEYHTNECHGDTTLENIIVEKVGKEKNFDIIRLIDPVPVNVVSGLVHDFSKILQSLYGYETIRDKGVCTPEDFKKEKRIFTKFAHLALSKEEYRSLKFFTAILFFRRLRYQEKQDISLVKQYGEIAFKLIEEFKQDNYNIE